MFVSRCEERGRVAATLTRALSCPKTPKDHHAQGIKDITHQGKTKDNPLTHPVTTSIGTKTEWEAQETGQASVNDKEGETPSMETEELTLETQPLERGQEMTLEEALLEKAGKGRKDIKEGEGRRWRLDRRR